MALAAHRPRRHSVALRVVAVLALGGAASVAGRRAHADAPPRLLSSPEVEAPRDSGLAPNASVVLLVTLDATGAVTEVVVLEGVRADIDAEVVRAARAMRFSPAEREGQPVAARVRFRFRLRPAAPPVTPGDPTTSAPGSTAVAPEPPRAVSANTPRTARPRRARRRPGPRRGVEAGVTVRGRYEPGAATRATFRAEELTTVPGTFGEPTRIVATQPGVARTPFGLGYFVVRGASFENTGFFIDGFPVLVLYHLAAGPAVISSRLVGQLDFYPGGYPLQFGRFSGGVISLETRPPPTERPRAEIEVDFFRASALGVIPFDNGRGSIAFAARRSYYDLLLPALQPGVNVNYADGQLRADYRFSERLRGSIFFFGSSDLFDRTQATGGGSTVGSARDRLQYNFGRAIGRLEYTGPGGISAQLGLMVGYDDTFVITADPGRPDRGLRAFGGVVGQRASVRIPTGRVLTTTIGIDNIGYIYNIELAYPQPGGFGSVPMPQSNPRVANITAGVSQFGIAPYIEEVVRAGRLEVTSGARVDFLQYSGNTFVVVDPRLVVRARVHDAVTVVGATGIFHQPPPFFSLIPQSGNPNLLPQRSWQSSLGVELTLPGNFEARVTGFVSRMWQLPRPTYEVIETPTGPQRAYALSDGEGLSYGMEVLVRRRLERGVYGWLSYTLSRSERFIGAGRVVPFTYDQTHVLNVAASWDITDHWRVGIRFGLATGSPTSAVNGGIYDSDADGYRPQYVSESDRLPLYHQLDTRVDYTFRLGPIRMSAYLDVLNVYYARTAEGWVYQYDYQDRRPRPGLPILPTLGLRGTL